MSFDNLPSTPDLHRDIHHALKSWNKPDEGQSSLQHLRIVQQHYANGSTWRQANNHVLLQALQELESVDPDAATLLRTRFLNNRLIQEVAHQQNIAESTVHRRQTAAIDRLGEILCTLEQRAHATQQNSLELRLPAPGYSQIFGIEPYLTSLRQRLISADPPWIIALHGIGGIGKTTLADALLRQMLRQGELFHLGWVTAKQQIFNLGGSLHPVAKPVLTSDRLIDALASQVLTDQRSAHRLSGAEVRQTLIQHFKQRSHLIVIDNLETVQDVDSLLPLLRDFANPSRFVLTTRESLFAEADIYHHPVPELAYSDALRLVRHEAQMRNLPDVVSVPDEALTPIYEAVGGNPLALRLVVGQLHTYSLSTILNDLRSARGEQIENLYTFIYQQAWARLDEPTRNVLVTMPLVPPDGADLAYLQDLCEVPSEGLRRAIQTLVTHNLVDVRGTIQQRLYTIHGLTRSFLHRHVVQWPT